MSRNSYANRQARKKNLPTIKEFLDEAGLYYEHVHGFEWHIRVYDKIDIFPTSNRYHILKTGARGSFEDYDELGRIFMESIL